MYVKETSSPKPRLYRVLSKRTEEVFIDLSKAFDTLDHNILLDKLWHYGIRGVPHTLFKSHLEHRKQLVINKDTMSDYQSTKCGDPQGSILGPLLFLIYINLFAFIITYSSIHTAC